MGRGSEATTWCQGKLADYMRPGVSHASTENTITVSAHLQPAFALQLGWGSKLQVGYESLMDRP